jgi:hypothetical protein
VGRLRASLSRDFDYRSLQHDSDTRARLRAVDPLPCEAVAPVHVCSARCSTCAAHRRAEEPCRLPFSSAPSLAGDVPYLSVPGARPMVWLAGKRGELVASLQRAAWAGNPRAKDPRSDIGAPMNGIARVPLLLRFRAPYVVSSQSSERLEPLSALAGADQDLRSTAPPRRVTTFGRPGCLGRFVSTCAEKEIARLASTDRPRGHAGSEDPLQAWRPAPFLPPVRAPS